MTLWSWTWHSTVVKQVFLNITWNSKYFFSGLFLIGSFSVWRILVVLTVIAKVLETLLYFWQVCKKWRLLIFCWCSQNQLQNRFKCVKYIDHYKKVISHRHPLITVACLEILFKVSLLKILSAVIYCALSIFSNSLQSWKMLTVF